MNLYFLVVGEGKGYPIQYFGLENSMDYTTHGVAKSQTRLTFTFTISLLFLCCCHIFLIFHNPCILA